VIPWLFLTAIVLLASCKGEINDGPGPGGTTELGGIQFSPAGGTFAAPFELALTAGTTITYTLDGSMPAESLDAGLVVEGPLPIEGTTWVRARLLNDDGTAGPVVSQAYIAVAEELASFDSNLPLVVVDSFGHEIDEESDPWEGRPFRPVTAVFIDTEEGGRASILGAPDHAGYGGMHVRGASTSEYDKKQYALETWDEFDEDTDVSLLGFPEESDWILHAPYADKSLMRNHRMYGWSNEAGRYAVRTRFVELFYGDSGQTISDEDYRGVYVFMEKIKRGDDRVDLANLTPEHTAEPDISGGYILKKDWIEEEDEGAPTFFETDHYEDLLLYVDPKPENITEAQRAWIRDYVNRFEEALYGPDFTDPDDGYAGYIDVDTFIDHHLLVELGRNVDGYVLSTYLFKDRGGKLSMGPIWDYNGALGNPDYFEAWDPQGWHYENEEFPADNPTAYLWYERLFEDPAFRQRYHDRWVELRGGVFATGEMLQDIQDDAAVLEEGAARNFDCWDVLGDYVWPNADGWEERDTYAKEVEYLAWWVERRLEWMDGAVEELAGD